MKQTILITLAGICILAGVFAACNSKPEDPKACETKPLNPNGDSELALLMREMTKSTESMSAALKNGTDFPEKPEGFEKIIKAVRTDSTIEQGPYEIYAKAWLSALDRLYAAPENNRPEMFNALVSNCESCHHAYCHGPLERIAKMHVK
jgi:cytochrome c556